ncbi:MAG: response regulator transcription factor [Arenicellales bacterium]|jgi:two-component system OmpR family response regulator|nr:DNA-binding response regulator [Acidiferrobacteraceae bacterium]MDP6123568.1 response regulator transcription factor [Arenicellales bacterium]MDP7155544.1 response regulator transcription factor [Arenicellales bacterium]|tara:strand:- start:126 stop:878 length:753 start_codon:yes stop_codon:yes gene_type:complete
MTPLDKPKRILVVDDERDIRSLVERYLKREGFRAYGAENGDAMITILKQKPIDLIILDVRLPGKDGLSLTRELKRTCSIPIILLTSKSDVIDRVAGLESGADDYLPKPFDLRELLARINAVMRRSTTEPTKQTLQKTPIYKFSDWVLNVGTRELRSSVKELIPLSAAEFDLLHALIEHPNRVLSRDFLLDITRGRTATPFDRTIDVRIGHLRRKLGENGEASSLIKTVRSAGYMFTGVVTELEVNEEKKI